MATMTTKITPTSQTDLTSLLPEKLRRVRPCFDPPIVKSAVTQSFVKLNPRTLINNPVMFVVEVGAAITTIFFSICLAFQWTWSRQIQHPWSRRTEQVLQQRYDGPVLLAAGLQNAE